MRGTIYALLAAASLAVALLESPSALADDADVLAIQGDVSRQELGSGAGVIVGIVDSGVKSTHPALSGRQVAAQDFVGDGDTSADDISTEGHGTAMASAILSSDPTHTGLAPSAQYVNARVLNAGSAFSGDSTVMNGVGYAVSQHVNVMNLSLDFNPPSNTSGTDGIDLILDWAAEQGVNVTVSAGNIAAHRDETTGEVVLDDPPSNQFVRSPGSAYNVVTVGRTGVPVGEDPNAGPITANTVLNYDQIMSNSATGPINSQSGTADRDKPDLVAPGTYITLANNMFTPGQPSTYWTSGLNGTSISSALVCGMMAQEIGYGISNNLSTSPLVIKATMMASADPVYDKVLPSTSGPPNLTPAAAWAPRASSNVNGVLVVTAPLDADSGAGQIDGARLYQQYSAGQQRGTVNSIGWDLNTISGAASSTYNINTPEIAGSQINVSLNWFRQVLWTDTNHDNVADYGDSFTAQTLGDLNLKVLVNSTLVAESISAFDNEQFLSFLLPQSGTVSIEVDDLGVSGAPMSEQYGLAWNIVSVPEPAAWALAVCGAMSIAICLLRGRNRRGNQGRAFV
ncbi:MAG TPA: S8 family serine peptidase [Pirellulales bacterium]|nr:S8 family serine peptidase [Pirellulales bacterium]